MMRMLPIIRVIRPEQWVKNVFVFIPVFFGGSLRDAGGIIVSLLTFVAFSLAASSVYCFNDIIDVADDRRHPVKCHRPIAAGEVSVGTGWMLVVLMALLSAVMTALLPENRAQVAMVIAGYYVMNMAYCVRLKQYAIVDVCVIAAGFVLRILAGGVATGIRLSSWIVLMTFLLTLFMAFAKRRDDVLHMNRTGKAPRRNTVRYNITFMNQAITITATITLVCYIMYTVSPEVVSRYGTDYLYLTSIFVILGLLRYIQIAVVDEKSGDPTQVALHDRFIKFVIIGWGVAFLIIIYM